MEEFQSAALAITPPVVPLSKGDRSNKRIRVAWVWLKAYNQVLKLFQGKAWLEFCLMESYTNGWEQAGCVSCVVLINH